MGLKLNLKTQKLFIPDGFSCYVRICFVKYFINIEIFVILKSYAQFVVNSKQNINCLLRLLIFCLFLLMFEMGTNRRSRNQ
jgi:hypothetical protein